MFSLPGFAIKTQIYESANSLVYRGINQQDQTPVILKVLKEGYPTRAEITRYKQEYEIILSLNVEGVIKAYSLQQYQNTLVIIFEDFGGESLQKLMKVAETIQFPMPLGEFLRLAIQITKILGGIHSSNIIHKDINPSNIALNPQTGQVKIIDFGISTQLTSTNLTLSHPNVLEGTLAYMSPEQTGRMNRSLDYRTDFYSLGVTFYELLTGQLPFTTTDVLELVHCHLAKQPVPPHLLQGDTSSNLNSYQCPKAVSDIVMKLMAKTAEERYQSTWGIVADLEECLLQLETIGRIQEFTLGAYDSSDKFQIPQKLYGREAEVATLLTAFERVATDGIKITDDLSAEGKIFSQAKKLSATKPAAKTEMMLVVGYSGIGKSALVAEVYKPITQKKGYFISGKFDQLGRNIPYSAVVSAFTELVRQLLSESEANLNQWRTKLLSALGSNAQVIIDVIPEVELIVGKQQPLPELGVTESQNRFNLVFQNFIRVFCDRNHPLVIFLDDLQWADLATLKLIQLMMTDANIQYLFLIGAYRDNEVSPTHPLIITLEKLHQEQVIINQINLAPLKLIHVSQLIADTLHSDIETVKPLAELVLQKTEGNPFFIKEFLKTLYAEHLITFSSEEVRTQNPTLRQSPKWEWDITTIEAVGITDNVVELMIHSLSKLSQSTQKLLRFAACVGIKFELKTLSIISGKSLREVFKDLGSAIQEKLILPLSDVDEQLLIQNYKFRHDRIQQAAYTLIAEEERTKLHLQIGRLLSHNTLPDQLSERIFEIVDHLNRGIELVSSQDEQNEIARLNLIAGKKAKSATAYDSAVRYLKVGRELLGEDSWKAVYDLALALYVESVEAEYLNTNYGEVEALSSIVLQRASTLLEKTKVYVINILLLSAQHQMQAAINLGLEVLKLLGVSLSELRPQTLKIEELYNLPTMTDPYKEAALRILIILFAPIYIANPGLLPLLSFTLVKLCINYGNSPLAAYAYGLYGLVLCGILGDIESGYQFGTLALRILDKFDAKEIECRVYNNFYSFIIHWKEATRKSLQPLCDTVQIGLETGEIEFTCYAATNYCQNLVLLGEPLDHVASEIEKYIALIQSLKQEYQVNYLQAWKHWISVLKDSCECSTESSCNLDKIEKLLELIPNNDLSILYHFYLAKTIIAYFFKDYSQAVANAKELEKCESGMVGLFPSSQSPFYYSLALLAHYPSVSVSEQIEYLEKVEANQRKMKAWADHAPMNYLHKYELVEAEKVRVLGQYWEATELYEQAIRGARENQYLHEEGLAYELAAEFYLAQGRSKIAETYLTEAYHCYLRWQATSKVKDLEKRYPQFFEHQYSSTAQTTISSANTSNHRCSSLDLNSVIKASQALSGELALESLLAKMMKIVIENAGAQTGYLILHSQSDSGYEQGQWVIEASGTAACEQVQVLQSIPIETVSGSSDTPLVSNAIANYVIHTQTTLVLQDAVHEGEFTRDPYILKQKPKSILCTPLIHQGKLVGILYLENNLTTGAFTPDRLEVLNLLSSQAAISIENAKLYAQLHESESKWTQLLEAVPVGISVHDFKGKVCYVNQTGQRLLGRGIYAEATPEQLIQTYPVYIAQTNQLYPAEKMPAFRALKGEQVIAEDVEIHRDGTIIPFEVRATPVFDENGNIIYAVNTFQDITDRKQAEKLLTDYNRTLEAEVTQRTAELTQINQQLEREIADRKYTEDALRRYERIVSTTTDAIALIDRDYRYQVVNQTYQTWCKKREEDIIGHSVREILGADVFETIVKQLLDRCLAGETLHYQSWVDHESEERRFLSINYVPYVEPDHTISGVVVSWRDLTELKQAEEELQRSEERLQLAFEGSGDGFWDWNIATGEIYWSPQWFTMLGYEVDEFPGELRTWQQVVHPDDLPWITEKLNAHLKDASTVYNCDYRLRTKSGTWKWISTYGRVVARDEQGIPVRMAGIHRDINEKRRAEEALRESEQRYRQMIETSEEGIWVIDLEGKTLFANPKMAQMLGCSVEEMLGLSMFAFMDEDGRAIANWNLERQSIQEKHDFKFRRKDGSDLWTIISTTPIFDESGQCTGALGMLTDITQRKQAEEALAQSERLFRLLAEISPVGIFRSDAFGKTIYANERACQIVGVPLDEGLGWQWDSYIHPEDANRVQQTWQYAITHQMSWQDEYRLLNREGEVVWVLAQAEAERDGTGKVMGYVGTLTDISDRKAAEIALREQKELLQAIFDHIPVMLCFYNAEAQIELLNPAMENTIGWSFEEIRQIDIMAQCYPDPDYRAALLEFMMRADGTWRDVQLRTRAGKVLETAWANVRLPNGWQVGIGQDITERKRAELALQESESRFREIAETISQFFFVRSATSGQYLYVNPAYERIWGRTCESLYQNPLSWLETLHPDDRSVVLNSLHEQFQGKSVKREYRIIRPNGQERWIVADISVIRDEAGQPLRFVGLAEDITERKQAEVALREGENRFRAVFEKAAVGIGLCTLEGRFFRVNQKLCSIVGYSDAEMLERTFEQITPVKDRLQMREFAQQLLAGEIENYSLEHRYICKDGSLVWVNVAVSLMHEPAGEPKSFIYVAEDISDRKLAELALLKSEHALAEAQRLARLGNWSFDLLTREFTWSEETFRIYGLDPTQGEPTEEQHLQQLHPDDRQKVLRSIERAVTQGIAYEHEIRIFLPNGSMRYTLRRGQPVVNEMGQVVKLFGTVQDITERKQAEQELRQSEEKFRQLAENIEEVFFILSQAGEIIYISPAYEHIWGRTCQSLYDNPRSWLQSVYPEEQQAMAAALNRQIRDMAAFDEIYRIVRPDGEIRWIRARSFPIEHQNTYRFVGIAEDISDRKLAEEALQKAKEAAEAANQAKSAFLANMSHELRTPLNAILGFSQLMASSASLPVEHQKNLDTIIHSGEHLLTLINQVLDLSKIEAGRATLTETNFNFYHFLDDVKDMFQLKANNKGLYLQLERSLDLPPYIRTDEVKLRQILINLLSNAMKFTASGGVSLRVSRGTGNGEQRTENKQENIHSQYPIPNSQLHFEIEDTGSGIAPEELESIFEAFVQTKTGQQFQEGTGLGLTITLKFVQLMGGEISINSQVGKGTVISFDIQATTVAATDVERKFPTSRVIALAPNQPSYRLLIVDDHADNRQVLIELLAPFGFELKEASNGLEALEIWEDWKPHLVFMDMWMPLMDGYEATQQIRAKERGIEEQSKNFPCQIQPLQPKIATKIIAVTASSLEEERTLVLSVGCDDFIRKPFPEAEIFNALHQHLGVCFIYDEPTVPSLKARTQTDISIFTAITTLPADLVADLRQALLELDVERVQTSIEQIRLLNEALADAIATFANKFQYEQLLNFISST